MRGALILFAVSTVASSAADDISLSDASRASLVSSTRPETAKCSGAFSITKHESDVEEPDIWTAATFKMSFAPGKLVLDTQFQTEKFLVTTTNPDGTKSAPRVVDSPTDRVIVLDDGDTVYKISYNPRFRPAGCRIEIFKTRKSAVAASKFPISDPVRPQLGILPVAKLVQNVGPNKLDWSRGDGRYFRGVFHVSNSPNVRIEFQVDPATGNQLVSRSVFNLPSKVSAQAATLKWAQTKEIWYVQQVDVEKRYSKRPVQTEQVTYTDYQPGVSIPESEFDLSSFTIPPGTRTIDRR